MAGKFAKGTKLNIKKGEVFEAVASLTDISGVEISADEVETTAHDSPDNYREFEAGLKDGGSVAIEGNFTNVASQSDLKDLLDSGVLTDMEIEFPSALGKWTFKGFVKSFSTSAPLDDKLGFSAEIKISGKPVLV